MTEQTKKISLREVKSKLWDKGYFVFGYSEAGIKTYKIWDIRNIKEAKKVKEHIDLKDVKEFYYNLKWQNKQQ